MRRISIKLMMWYVSFIAVGLAALRNANEAWAGVMIMLTLGTLGAAIIAIVCRRGRERIWWFGFALFGAAYTVLTLFSWFAETRKSLATTHFLVYLTAQAVPAPLSSSEIGEQLQSVANQLNTTDSNDPGYADQRWRYMSLQRQLKFLSNSTTSRPTSSPIQRLLPGIENPNAFARIGHCIFALLAGLLGAFISSRMYREPQGGPNGIH